jgi:hypothetical protein
MDIRRLSEADKYMLYGLLLRKKRPAEAELRVMEIMRAPLKLDQKIDAILALHRELPGATPAEEEQTAELLRAGFPGRPRRRLRAVVADPHPDVTRLLAKGSLRWELEFVQAETARQALYLVRRLRARLLVCNLPMPPGEREAFARECRRRQSRVRLIFLAPPAPGERTPAGGPTDLYRLLPKPINLTQLSEAARELLES